MRIGIVASNWRPLKGDDKNVYAPGVIITTLADGLVDRGHKVTLFAPNGTKTKAKLISENLNAASEDYYDLWMNDPGTFWHIQLQYELMLVSKAFEMAKSGLFDVLQIHKTNIEIYFSNLVDCPVVVSAHSAYHEGMTQFFSPADEKRLEKYQDTCFYTSPSNFIKDCVKFKNIEVIPHGVDLELFKFDSTGGEELLFTGRIVERKGADVAVDVSLATKKPLKMVGDLRPTKTHREFWKTLKKRIGENEDIEYLGFKTYFQMPAIYAKAKALIYPVILPETFGLVLIEAMACGTPVIAFDKGPVKEIVEDGVTGFVCPSGNNKAMEEAISKIYNMNEKDYLAMRQACRKRVEENYNVNKMIDGYECVFEKAIDAYKKRNCN